MIAVFLVYLIARMHLHMPSALVTIVPLLLMVQYVNDYLMYVLHSASPISLSAGGTEMPFMHVITATIV